MSPSPSPSSDRSSYQKRNWERYWLQGFGTFHRIASNQPLPTDETAVKEFLIKLREQGKAAWQRLQVLRYIINYTKDHLHLDTQALEAMASKLDSLARREKFSQLTNVNDRAGIIATNEPLIVQELRKCIRVEAKKLTTEKAYVKWIKRFAERFELPPESKWEAVDESHVEEFLSELALEHNVAPSTQNQAFCALLYVFENVLHSPLEKINAVRAKENRCLPSVLSVSEVERLMAQFRGRDRLIARMLYGCGLRIGECVSLRVKDIDFERRQVIVRDTKGCEDRTTLLPELVDRKSYRWSLRSIAEARGVAWWDRVQQFHALVSSSSCCVLDIEVTLDRITTALTDAAANNFQLVKRLPPRLRSNAWFPLFQHPARQFAV